jgi:Carboxypeptidase regulatory-like domain
MSETRAVVEQALKLASHITNPYTVVVFVACLAALVFYPLKNKRIAYILAIVLTILALGTLAASTFVQLRGVYRVRVTVLGPDGSPVDDAHVSSSIGGEPKKVEGGWEFDIPPQTRPADGKVIFFASEASAFLTGRATLILAQDYYPTTTIQLIAETSAMIRGVVVDERRRPVDGATVSVAGYKDVTVTDKMGNFTLPAHAADGQIVEVRAQKDELVGSISVPAGNVPVEVMVKRP